MYTILVAQIILFILLFFTFILTNIISADYFVYARLRFYFEDRILSVFRHILIRAQIIDDTRQSFVDLQQRLQNNESSDSETVTDHFIHQREESSFDLPPSYTDCMEPIRT